MIKSIYIDNTAFKTESIITSEVGIKTPLSLIFPSKISYRI